MAQACFRCLDNCFNVDFFVTKARLANYNWFVLKNIAALKSPTTSDAEKVEALKHIANMAYLGTRDKSSQIVVCILPLLLSWLRDWNALGSTIHKPLLKCLSMLSHRNRFAQEMVLEDLTILQPIARLIANTENASISRWACYFLLHLISDNGRLLAQTAANMELRRALKAAAAAPWDTWYERTNLAQKLLRVLFA